MSSRRKEEPQPHLQPVSQPHPVDSAEGAAAAYARDGLFWMQGVLSDEELAALQAAAAESFNQILRTLMVQVMSADLYSSGGSAPAIRYAEVVARDGARFDCRHGMDMEPLASLLRPGGLAAALVPLLRRVLGEDAEVCQVGQIIAMTEEHWEIIHGEADTFVDQKWHTDGRSSAYDTDALTVFIPLVDVTPTNGATEFVLGSHAEAGGDGGGAETDEERSARATPLLLPAGSAVAFDYRTCARPTPPHTARLFRAGCSERRVGPPYPSLLPYSSPPKPNPAYPSPPRRSLAQVAPWAAQQRRA